MLCTAACYLGIPLLVLPRDPAHLNFPTAGAQGKKLQPIARCSNPIGPYPLGRQPSVSSVDSCGHARPALLYISLQQVPPVWAVSKSCGHTRSYDTLST